MSPVIISRSLFLLTASLLFAGTSAAQEIEWLSMNDGLWGGSIQRIVASPNGSLFALHGNSFQEGRLYRSVDGGEFWTGINTGAPEISIQHLVIFPDGEILASTDQTSVLRSVDDGDTWVRIETDKSLTAGLALHPSGNVFGAEYRGNGVLKSSDRGSTWSYAGLDSTDRIDDIDVTLSGSILVANDAGLFRSDDEGESWERVGSEWGDVDISYVSVAADSSIFVDAPFVDVPSSGDNSVCVHRSMDDGVTWMGVECSFHDPRTGDVYIAAITADRDGNIVLADWGRIYTSSDGGSSWSASTDTGSSISDDSFLLHEGRMYVGLVRSGVAVSDDNGASWRIANRGIDARWIKALAHHPDGWIFALTEEFGVFRRRNRDSSWEEVVFSDFALEIVISQAGDIFVSAGLVYRSSDLGESWTPLADGCFGTTMAFAPDGTLYLADYTTFRRFQDDGETCDIVSEGLLDIDDIAFATNGDFLVGTASGFDGPNYGVFRSTDRGETWEAMAMSPFSKSIVTILVKPNGVVLAGAFRSGLYRSDDGGYSFDVVWEPPYIGYVQEFAVAPSGDVYAATLSRIFLSTDDGRSWTDAGGGIPEDRIFAASFDEEGYLYVGTDGAGVYRSVQPVPTSSQPEPAIPDGFVFRPNFPNPFDDATTISFAVSRTEHVRLSIYNGIGQEIEVLVDGVLPSGEHKVEWNAATATSGTYFCRIRNGNHVAVQALVLVR